jgi:hypothetical protein
MTRRHLPNRRGSETFSFQCSGMNYHATVSYFDDGSLGEIFLGNGKVDSHADTAARDSAVVASIALQHGVSIATLRSALLRDARGNASGPLGVALDMLAESEGEHHA